MWLNEPVEITDDYRVITEAQSYWADPVWPSTTSIKWQRSRKTTWTTTRYVGCDQAAAQVKADALSIIITNTDVHSTPVGGGQYHVLSTSKIEAAWSAWAPA